MVRVSNDFKQICYWWTWNLLWVKTIIFKLRNMVKSYLAYRSFARQSLRLVVSTMLHGLLKTDFRRECMAVFRRWVSTFSRSHMSTPRCSSNIACVVVKTGMNIIEIPCAWGDQINIVQMFLIKKNSKKPTWRAINADNVLIFFIFHKGNVSQM